MVSVSPLRAAATVIDEAAGSLRAALDHKLPVLFNRSAVFEARGAHAQTAMRQAEEAVELLRTAGPRGEPLAATMQSDVEYLHRVFDGRPFADARHSFSSDHQMQVFEIRAERARLLDSLAEVDDATARGQLEARLERPLRGMVAGDPASRREVGLLMGMPDAIRPRHLQSRLGASVWDAIAVSSDRGSSLTGSDAIEDATAAIRRYELGRMSPSQLDRHVETLLGRDPDSLALGDVRELALAATLPDHVPAVLASDALLEPRRLRSVIAARDMRTDGRPMLHWQDSFLRELEAARLVRDGAAPTRVEANRELAAILDTPFAELTPAQERRISLLVHLPLEHRPNLPTAPEAWRFTHLGLRSGLQDEPDRRLRMLEAARSHYHDLRDPTAALEELRSALAEDRPFNVHRMATLLNDPVAVKAAGIDDAMIARAMTRELQRAGTREVGGAPLRQILEASRERLTARTLRPEFEQVRTETLELLDRNIDRMTGMRSDTYGRHPDYAEVGRVVAQLQLLDAVDRQRAATAVARTASETLTW